MWDRRHTRLGIAGVGCVVPGWCVATAKFARSQIQFQFRSFSFCQLFALFTLQ